VPVPAVAAPPPTAGGVPGKQVITVSFSMDAFGGESYYRFLLRDVKPELIPGGGGRKYSFEASYTGLLSDMTKDYWLANIFSKGGISPRSVETNAGTGELQYLECMPPRGSVRVVIDDPGNPQESYSFQYAVRGSWDNPTVHADDTKPTGKGSIDLKLRRKASYRDDPRSDPTTSLYEFTGIDVVVKP
jgi:hypothetical protein